MKDRESLFNTATILRKQGMRERKEGMRNVFKPQGSEQTAKRGCRELRKDKEKNSSARGLENRTGCRT